MFIPAGEAFETVLKLDPSHQKAREGAARCMVQGAVQIIKGSADSGDREAE